jgi:hypothetical protein
MPANSDATVGIGNSGVGENAIAGIGSGVGENAVTGSVAPGGGYGC